jgi:23S rRNA G2445 N2-methylase RlmL
MHQFTANERETLYNTLYAFTWANYFKQGHTMVIEALTGTSSFAPANFIT